MLPQGHELLKMNISNQWLKITGPVLGALRIYHLRYFGIEKPKLKTR